MGLRMGHHVVGKEKYINRVNMSLCDDISMPSVRMYERSVVNG